MATSLRTASRIVNVLRVGTPTSSLADLKKVELVFLAVPDEHLGKWVERLSKRIDGYQGVGFVCCSSRLDSGALAELGLRGAAIGSLSEMEGFEEKRFLFEGDLAVLRRIKRMVEAGNSARIVEMNKRMRPVYEAGLTFAAGMTFPMISAAVDTMQAAGMHVKAAENAVEAAVIGALRAYLRAGRRGWTGPIASSDRDELRRQYQAVFAVDEELAEMYLKIAVDYLAEVAARPRKDPAPRSLELS